MPASERKVDNAVAPQRPAAPSPREPVQDLFSVPARPIPRRHELPITAPSPILAMQPQVAAEVAKSLATEAALAKAAEAKAAAQAPAPTAPKPGDES